MREFENARSRLRRLDPGARLVYTAFLVFTAAGVVTAALLHGDGMGVEPDTAALYWAGDEEGMAFPKSYRQLLELTHFHLFTEPVTWLVLAHLYNLGGDPARRRGLVTVGTLVTMTLQIALPWGVVYGSTQLAMLLIPVHVLLGVGFLYMIGASLWEMWGPGS